MLYIERLEQRLSIPLLRASTNGTTPSNDGIASRQKQKKKKKGEAESEYWCQSLPPIKEDGHSLSLTRLIILVPGIITDALRHSLKIVNVENAPPYKALPYIWSRNTAESSV
jgi:hypothetical protein